MPLRGDDVITFRFKVVAQPVREAGMILLSAVDKNISSRKACKKCQRILPLEDFYRRKSSSDGLFNTCKKCLKVYNDDYRKKHWKKTQRYNRRYYRAHRGKKGGKK